MDSLAEHRVTGSASPNNRLRRQALIDAGRIKVEADGSKVILNGSVRSWAEKEDAAKTAGRAPGVTEVQNDLEVHPSLQSVTQAESLLMESM